MVSVICNAYSLCSTYVSNLYVMSSIVKFSAYFKQHSTGIRELSFGVMTSLFQLIRLEFYTIIPEWGQLTRRQFLTKCGILLNYYLWVSFTF